MRSQNEPYELGRKVAKREGGPLEPGFGKEAKARAKELKTKSKQEAKAQPKSKAQSKAPAKTDRVTRSQSKQNLVSEKDSGPLSSPTSKGAQGLFAKLGANRRGR